MYFNLLVALFFFVIWIGVVAFLRVRKQASLVYLVYFTLFYIYLFKVLDYTLFQYQSLILLRYFHPNLMLRGQSDGESINLVPLVTLSPHDVKTSLLNILLLIPFGFGLPFITRLLMKGVVLAGAFFSIGIEFLQVISGWMARTTFRIADINDVIFNTTGAAIGYALFLGFVRIYRNWSRDRQVSSKPILQYIAERPQIIEKRR